MISVGHVFNVPIPTDFEHVENVLHESFTDAERQTHVFPRSAREQEAFSFKLECR